MSVLQWVRRVTRGRRLRWLLNGSMLLYYLFSGLSSLAAKKNRSDPEDVTGLLEPDILLLEVFEFIIFTCRGAGVSVVNNIRLVNPRKDGFRR